MTSINGIGSTSPVQKIVSSPVQKSVPADAPQQQKAVDRLELSGVAHLFKTLKANDIRTEKVASIRAQIDAGTYEDEGKLDAASDKLLDELQK